jgi:hypothetical protein
MILSSDPSFEVVFCNRFATLELALRVSSCGPSIKTDSSSRHEVSNKDNPKISRLRLIKGDFISKYFPVFIYRTTLTIKFLKNFKENYFHRFEAD